MGDGERDNEWEEREMNKKILFLFIICNGTVAQF